MSQVTVLTVFIASPGDVKEQREAVVRCLDELNQGLAKTRGVRLEAVRWETHVRPALGRPQGVVNAQTGPMEEHALFIGIMGSRFGTATGEADSGTEEEFGAAKASFETTGRPDVMFYFAQNPSLGGGAEAARQYVKVAEFQEALHKLGIMGDYRDPEDFERKIRRDLTNWLMSRTQEIPGTSPQAEIQPPARTPLPAKPLRVEDSGMWMILGDNFLKAAQVTQQGRDSIEVVFPSSSSAEDNAVRRVAATKGSVPFAQGSDAAIVEVTGTRKESSAKGTHWTVTLKVKDALEGHAMSESATLSHSADQIAELRVRRALLDTMPVELVVKGSLTGTLNNAILINMIEGMSAPVKVTRGAIPGLAEDVNPDSPDFLSLARLYAILMLRGSYAVGAVERLILERSGENEVRVEFRGQRPKFYSNVEPPTITVNGICPIRSEPDTSE